MKVNKAEFLEALNKVKPGLSSNEIIDQSTHFVFSNDFIFTFNDEIAVRVPFKTGLTCAVPSKELLAFVSRTKVEEIELEFKDDELKASASRIRTGIKSQGDINLPIEEIALPKDFEWENLPDNFMSGLAMTIPYAGKDTISQSLECIHIQDNIMESCDNYRLSVFEMGSDWTGETLIPARNLAQLQRYDPIKYLSTADWVHFLNSDDTIFSTRPYADSFTDLDPLLDVQGVEVTFPEELGQALSDAEIFVSDAEQILVTVTISKSQIKVKGEGDIGWLEEIVRYKYKGEEIAFTINPVYLKHILGSLDNIIVGTNSIKFTGDNCVHIIALGA